MVFILTSVINMKIPKIGTNFLALEVLDNCLTNKCFYHNLISDLIKVLLTTFFIKIIWYQRLWYQNY